MTRCYQELLRHEANWRWDNCYGVSNYETDTGSIFNPEDPRQGILDQLVSKLGEALRIDLIVQNENQEKFASSLQHVLQRSANVGVSLLSQAYQWRVEWKSHMPGHLVFPEVIISIGGEDIMPMRAKVETRWHLGGNSGYWFEEAKHHKEEWERKTKLLKYFW
ncbi:hypothetical protein BGZ63DRAFT_407217 [Mariannaea sp. PMI_226]|nr:hypothetical protein BGZ63DRAFT_407217 [Mariannaea sp. PMI_226]